MKQFVLVMAAVASAALGEDLFVGRPVELTGGKAGSAAIVYGGANRAAAESLAQGIQSAVGEKLPVVEDKTVVPPGSFDYAPAWKTRPLILIGSVDDNRAFLALYARGLAAANERYPGTNRYVLRTLSEPLEAGADLVTIGAGDAAGLEAGIRRAVELIKADSEPGKLRLKPRIEVGSAAGPEAPTRWYRGGGIGGFYWEGNGKAGLAVRSAFLKELAADRLAGYATEHYTWEQRYRAVRQLLASGVFTEAQTREIQAALYDVLISRKDAFGLRALVSSPDAWNRRMTRHETSAFAGKYLLAEYLHHVAKLGAEKDAETARLDAHLSAILEAIAKSGRWRSGIEGAESLDVLANLANLLFLRGDETVLRSGVLTRMAIYQMANRDNLGCQAGVDSYIGSRPGEHFAPVSAGTLATSLGAWFLKDPELEWVARLDGDKRAASYLSVLFPPGFGYAPARVAPARPASWLGLQVLPLDPVYRAFAAEFPAPGSNAENFVRFDSAAGEPFDKAVFRDGFEPADAYLLLQGLNVSMPMLREGIAANAIVRYTELGSVFLFSHTQNVGSWKRNVVQISRGQADPQSSACVVRAAVTGSRVSLLQSLEQQNGGAAWTRTILRKRNGYFVVLDRVVPATNDETVASCRWRSFHDGKMADARRFVATDRARGTEMNLVSADALETTLEWEPRDGAAEPLALIQKAPTASGDVTFLNLFYASDRAHVRQLDIRRAGPAAALVQGTTEQGPEQALLATGALAPTNGVAGEAAAIYLAGDYLCAGGLKSLTLDNVTLVASGPVNLELDFAAGTGWIENPGDKPVWVKVDGGWKLEGERPREPQAVGESNGGWRVSSGRHPVTTGQPIPRRAPFVVPAAPAAKPDALAPAGKALKPRWVQPVMAPEPAPYRAFTLTVDPPPPEGSTILTDRAHHRWSPAVMAADKGGWSMTFDLAETRRVESIRFIETRKFLKGDTNLVFDVRIRTRDGDPRREAVRSERGVWYSEMEKYMYTGVHPTLTVPVGAETDRIVLAAPTNVASRGMEAFQEAEVLVVDPAVRIRSVLRVLPAGNLLVVRDRDVVCLDGNGREQWRYRADSPVVAQDVRESKRAGGVRIALWPLSNRFVLLDDKGREVVGPSAWDAPERKAILEETSRPACLALVEGSNALQVALFPHYRHGAISIQSGGPKAAFGEGRGGKAALVIPDRTGDGLEDIFVVGRFENNNGMVASGDLLSVLEGMEWTGSLADNWTGWSAGNMELSLFHAVSFVRGGPAGAPLLGIAAVNPGGIDYYRWPDLGKAWGHFNHPGNLALAVGDVTGDGIDEILVGREDGFLTAYEAATGATVWTRQLGDPVRAVAVNQGSVAAGTRRGVWVFRGASDPAAAAAGSVESMMAHGRGGFAVAFSDGVVKNFDF